MIYLKQSTGSQAVLIGPFVDDTDFKTAETGLTIANTDIRLSKGGANIVAKNSGGGTHDENGFYQITLDATDTNTVGPLQLHAVVSGALPVYHEFHVIEEAVYDDLFASSAAGYAGVSELATVDANIDLILADTGTDGVAISSSTIGAIADQVWDELAADHVAAGSFGAGSAIIRSNTAQAGASTTITLDASASATDDFYNDTQIEIVSGTGAGQKRFITDYDGTSKVATVSTWAVTPSSDSVFVIKGFGSLPGASAPTAAQVADAVWDEAMADHTASGSAGQALGGSILRTGTAQAGGASTITLDASASATNDLYRYNIVRIIGGTGAGQSRQISAYVGSSKVATVSLAWTTQPSSDSVFQIIALGVDAATVASIADGVWDEQRSGHVQAGSFGERVNANVTQVSGDTTAADNLESYCDGTTPIPANVTQISGDATAADNLESYCDGTTPQPVNATQISGDATAADNLEAALDGTGGVTISGNLSGSVGSVTGAINTGSGTITTLDALDTAQDTQHGTTRSDIATAQASLDNLEAGIIIGTAVTGTLSTTACTSDLTGYADDELIGATIVFTGGTANGQRAEITDYASASGLITFSGGIQNAPANNDTFKIV